MLITESQLRSVIRDIILTESSKTQFKFRGFYLIRKKDNGKLSPKLDLTQELGIDSQDMNVLDDYAVQQLEALDDDDPFMGMEYVTTEGTHIVREDGAIYAATPYTFHSAMNDLVRKVMSRAKRRNYNELASAPLLRYASEYHNTLGNISL